MKRCKTCRIISSISLFSLQLDCVAFAHLTQFIYIPFGGMKEWMDTETRNLVDFVERIKTKYWADWDEMCKTLELNTHLPKKEVPPEKEEEIKKEEAKKEEAKKEEERKKKEEKKKAQVIYLALFCHLIPNSNTPVLRRVGRKEKGARGEKEARERRKGKEEEGERGAGESREGAKREGEGRESREREG